MAAPTIVVLLTTAKANYTWSQMFTHGACESTGEKADRERDGAGDSERQKRERGKEGETKLTEDQFIQRTELMNSKSKLRENDSISNLGEKR